MHQYLGGERIKTMNFSIETMRKCHPVKAQPIRLLGKGKCSIALAAMPPTSTKRPKL